MIRRKVFKKISALMTAVMIMSAGTPVMAAEVAAESEEVVVETQSEDVVVETEPGEIVVETQSEDIAVDTGSQSEEIVVEADDNAPEMGHGDYVDEATNYTFVINNEDGTAEITGYSLIGSASDNLGDLNIPAMVTLDGQSYVVTSIGAEAFRGDTRFTGNLKIPVGVITINDDAFDGCCNLKGGIYIPKNVAYIGAEAFRECNGMDGRLVFFGEDVEEIGDNAFKGCKNLRGAIEFPDNLRKIGATAFEGCTGLDDYLYFGKGYLEEIGTSAFAGLNITGIVFQGKVGKIGDRAFYECCKCTEGVLVFQNDVNYIGKGAFEYGKYLRGNITLNNTTVRENAFEGCKNLGPTLTLGKNTSWDDDAGFYSHSFMYCCGIKKVINNSNNKFSLTALKSDSWKDKWGVWKDQKGTVIYTLDKGTATRDDFEAEYYITMQNGSLAYNPSTENVIYSAKAGDKIGITCAYAEDDTEFVKWESNSKGVKFAKANKKETTFTMPAEDVSITYVLKDDDPEPDPDPEDDDDYYYIDMQDGSAAFVGDEDQSSEYAKKGDVICIQWLYEGEDKEFVKWESENKSVIFRDPTDWETTFIMPAEDVKITYVEKDAGSEDPEPETKTCPNVVVKQKVDLSLKDYFNTTFDKKDKWTVEPNALGSVSKGIFTAKKPGEVTVTWTDKDKNVKGIVKFNIENPVIDYPINPKNDKKLSTITYNRIDEEIDVTKLISTETGLTPVRYECTDKKGKNFSFDTSTNIMKVLKSGSCKINVYYNYGDNEKNAAKYSINIKASLPKIKEKINLKATKSTTVSISNVQKDLKVGWVAFEYDEDGNVQKTDDLTLEVVPKSDGRKCKITASSNKGAEIFLFAVVGEEQDPYLCKVTIK